MPSVRRTALHDVNPRPPRCTAEHRMNRRHSLSACATVVGETVTFHVTRWRRDCGGGCPARTTWPLALDWWEESWGIHPCDQSSRHSDSTSRKCWMLGSGEATSRASPLVGHLNRTYSQTHRRLGVRSSWKEKKKRNCRKDCFSSRVGFSFFLFLCKFRSYMRRSSRDQLYYSVPYIRISARQTKRKDLSIDWQTWIARR